MKNCWNIFNQLSLFFLNSSHSVLKSTVLLVITRVLLFDCWMIKSLLNTILRLSYYLRTCPQKSTSKCEEKFTRLRCSTLRNFAWNWLKNGQVFTIQMSIGETKEFESFISRLKHTIKPAGLIGVHITWEHLCWEE